MSFSRRTHHLNLKPGISTFQCDFRTFYTRYMPIKHQHTQENVDLCTNCDSVVLCSSSVSVTLTQILMFYVSPSVCHWSYGGKGVEIGCGAWTEIAPLASHPWMINACSDCWVCCRMTLKLVQLRHIDGYHGVTELCSSRISRFLRLPSFSAQLLLLGTSN